MGDIATLEPGEILPCDGILVSGHRIRCDESSLTGETDPIKKHTFDESHGQYDGEKRRECFLLSGSKVLEGVGRYVVVAVGERSFNGRILMGTGFINLITFSRLIVAFLQPCESLQLLRLSKRNSTISPNSSLKSGHFVV